MVRYLFCCFVCIFSLLNAQADKLLQSLYPADTLRYHIVDPMQFKPVATAATYWQSLLGKDMQKGYIANGKQYLGKPWEPIPVHLFSEYATTGNRSNYEAQAFQRRRQLACMVMAEVIEGQSSFINDIIKGLYYFKQETWWGIPAHYPKSEPDASLQEVDLFNAETANLLAWTCYLLEERIKPTDAHICDDIRKEIRRRILIPARTIDYDWKRYSWNHNTWTCANWLSCILFCEEDRQQQIDDICEVLKSLDIFIDGYPEDGGCNEGPYYWDRATGSLFECMQLLSLASSNRITLPATKKIKAMADYICNVYIGDHQYINFAASPNKLKPSISILYPLGLTLNDQKLMQHAAFVASQQDFVHHPEKVFNQTANFPSISRELCFLRLLPSFLKTEAKEAQVSCVWMPDTEILAAHSDQLFVAVKGGHNNESHNHNDIGHFIVYSHNEPLFIDLGNDTYTAKTFSNERYTLMNTRSAFHNVPLINNQEQQAGKEYSSKDIQFRQDDEAIYLSLDIANAYPSSAQVKKWTRLFLLHHGELSVTESYHMKKRKVPLALSLMLNRQPTISDDGRIIINLSNSTYQLVYDKRQVKPIIETFDISQTAMRASWGNQVYRLRLVPQSKKKKGKITYLIQSTN